jgi:HlyD family secretion protein
MKKWIALGLVVLAIAGTWYYLRTYARPYTPIWFQPKFGTVTRGDIRVPITASGLIEPEQQVEVKSKASGEVIEVPVHEGTFVHAGQTLVVLKRDDEQRKFDAAQAEVERASSLRAQAQVAVEEAEANILIAQADIERLEAQCRVSAFDVAKIQARPDAYNEQEKITVDAQHRINLAQTDAARGRLAAAQGALKRAREAVALQEAVLRIAETQLGDAKERLDETTIVAKEDTLVTDVRIKVGEVIQSGTISLTGGTALMYLADVSRKKVIARVDESDYGRVLNISPLNALPETPGLREAAAAGAEDLAQRSGQVTLTVDAFPEDTFTGIIERVEPQGRLTPGAALIQYDVHVVITDPQASKLPLGAQAQVEFTVESATGVVRVPSDSVKNHLGQRGVWLQVPPEPGSNEWWGRKFVACRFGITDGEFTQVLEVLDHETKLEPDMKVYTKLPVDREKIEQ